MCVGKIMAGVSPLLGGPQEPSKGVQRTRVPNYDKLIEKAHAQKVADRVLIQMHGSIEGLYTKPPVHHIKEIEIDPNARVKWGDVAQTKSEQAEKGAAAQPHIVYLWTESIGELDLWTDTFLTELGKQTDANDQDKTLELLPELEQLYRATSSEHQRAKKLFLAATPFSDIDKPSEVSAEVIDELRTQRDAAETRFERVKSAYDKLAKDLKSIAKWYDGFLGKTSAELEKSVQDSTTILSKYDELTSTLDEAYSHLTGYRDLCEKRKVELTDYFKWQSKLDQVKAKMIGATLTDAMARKNRKSIEEYATKAHKLIFEIQARKNDLVAERDSWHLMNMRLKTYLKPNQQGGDHSRFSDTRDDVTNKIQAIEKAITFVEEAQMGVTFLNSIGRQAMELLTQLPPLEAPKVDPAKLQNVATAVDATANPVHSKPSTIQSK